MNLPACHPNQRYAAEISALCAEPLVVSAACWSVTDVNSDSSMASPLTHLNHTPSPLGQQGVSTSLLPSFSGAFVLEGVTQSSAPAHGHCLLVSGAEPSRQEAGTCSSNRPLSSPRCARALQPAGPRSPNKGLAAQPSGQGPQQSPAAALPKVRPLAQRATSPTATSTPADVANLSPAAFMRRTPFHTPAQLRLLRGFCVYPRPQKDTPCSRKS